MAINKKPQQVGLSDPTLVRQATTRLTQDAIAAKGKPAIIQGTAVLPRTTVQATATSVNVTTSANNQVADTTTIYRSSGAIYVSSIDQTIQQVTNKNIVNQVGVSQIVAGNNVTITSSVPDGIGIVTINTVLPTYGNVAVLNLDGNSANVLHGDGSWSADITTYGNSNVVTLLGSFGSNSISTTGNVTANVFEGNTVQSTGNVTIMANGQPWTFNSTGNVIFPSLTVDLHNGGNQAAQTLQFGNATQQAVITGPTPAANVNAQRLIIQGQRGNGELSEGGDVYFWAGDADLYGGDIKIYAGDADNVSAGGGGYVNIDGGAGFDNGGQVEITGGYSSSGTGGYANVIGGTGGTQGGDAKIQGGFGSAGPGGIVTIQGGLSANGVAEYGNVDIIAGTSTWVFGNDGVVSGYGNLKLAPDSTNASSYLDIFLSSGPDLHLVASQSANLILGKDAQANVMTSWNGNVYVQSWDTGTNTQGGVWTFDGDGNTTFPAAGNVNLGNVATANYFVGNGASLTAIAGANVSGEVGLATYATTANAVAGANVSGEVSYAATANAVAGANVSGEVGLATYATTANAVAGANVSGFVANANVANTAFLLANGNSNVNIATANGNITLTATSNTTMTITDTGANITGTANVTGNVIGGNISTAGQITSTQAGNLSDGGGQLYLNGTGNNRIDFNTNGTGAPTFTTRSAGAKVVLYPSIGASATDYAMGVAAGTFWTGIPAADGGQFFRWYGGTTEVANLSGTGILTTTGNITGSNVSTAGIVKTGVFTTGTIPAAATAGAGARAFVTDADSVTFKAAYVGGSGNAVPVFSDGSAWYIG